VTNDAVIDPQALSTEAATITAVVDWKVEMMDPIEMERMNWARKTMLLTIPTSVPIPRGISSCFRSSEYVLVSW